MLAETKGDIPTTFMHAFEDIKRLNYENQKRMDDNVKLTDENEKLIDENEKLKNLLRQFQGQQTFNGR